MSVRKVAESSPPITTVARGLCTSAPAEEEIAIGKKPKLATDAVIRTGRRRTKTPIRMRLCMFFTPSLAN